MILDLDDNVELKGGRLLHSSEVQYPVQITSDPISQDLFVATIFSEAEPANILRESPTNSRIYPGGQDLATTGYRTPQYGRRFSVRLQRMSPNIHVAGGDRDKELMETMDSTWTREFGTNNLDTVQVSSLVHLSSNTLVMAGYTRGSGPSFGYAENDDDLTLDGFLTKLNSESGDILGVKRISSLMPHGDDRILGLCSQKGATETDTVFVVGMTNGFFDETYLPHDYGYNEGSNFAFLMKLDLQSLDILWSRQLGAITTEMSQIDHIPQAHGMACSVTTDGQHVWMAGAVKNGDALSIHGVQGFASSGGDDIFVAQFRSADGYLDFARQIGTSEDDFLAEGNSIDTDGDGNLIVLGNTRGSLYRKKANYGVADLFALSVGRNTGEFVSAIEITGSKKAPITDGRDNSNSIEDNLVEGVDGSKSYERNPKQSHALISVGVLFGLLILLLGLALILERIRRREAPKVSIETENFDAVDMILEARTIKGWQKLVANAEFGRSAIEYGRNQAYDETSMNSGVPWEIVAFEDYSYSSSLKPQDHQSTFGSRSAVSGTSSLALQGEDDCKRTRRDPLLSNDDPAQDDPYAEIYDLLNEASERLAHKRQSGHASQRMDLLNQASERLSRRNDTSQTAGRTISLNLTPSISKDEFSINSLDEIWGSDII